MSELKLGDGWPPTSSPFTAAEREYILTLRDMAERTTEERETIIALARSTPRHFGTIAAHVALIMVGLRKEFRHEFGNLPGVS